MYSAHEGQSLTCTQEFIDEDGNAVTLKLGYPKAKLMMGSDTIADLYPEQQSPSTWSVTASIPELGFKEPTPIQLKWRAYDTSGHLHKVTDIVLVQPYDLPEIGDVVIMEDETTIRFAVPVHLADDFNVWLSIYKDNDALVKGMEIPIADREKFATYTIIKFQKPAIIEAQLKSYLMVVEYATFRPERQRLMNNLWVVTPQILNCMNALEASLNKAKIDNVIPQLDYSQSDLLHYLQRGLNLFNSYSPNLTGFTGTNMQGALFDSLLLCASYYALGAQLLAEGMLAFDFSGQAVTLNVDRTPQLEAALGRVESMIQDRVPKIKQMLLRRGVSGGTGSDAIGSSIGIGITVLSNAPTTSKNVFRPGFNQYYR